MLTGQAGLGAAPKVQPLRRLDELTLSWGSLLAWASVWERHGVADWVSHDNSNVSDLLQLPRVVPATFMPFETAKPCILAPPGAVATIQQPGELSF